MESDHVICHTGDAGLADDRLDGIPPRPERLQREPLGRAGGRVRPEKDWEFFGQRETKPSRLSESSGSRRTAALPVYIGVL